MTISIYKQWRTVFHYPLPLAVVGVASIGAALSPVLYIQRLVISYSLILSALVLIGYPLDAKYSDWKFLITDIQKWLKYIIIIGIVVTALLWIYSVMITNDTIILLGVIYLAGIVAYNTEYPKILHTKGGFAISWGGATAVGSYYFQSLQLNWVIIPLFITGVIISLQEWYTSNTGSPMQKSISKLEKSNSERRLLRKETFHITTLYSYTIFTIGVTLVLWRII